MKLITETQEEAIDLFLALADAGFLVSSNSPTEVEVGPNPEYVAEVKSIASAHNAKVTEE